MQKLLFRQAVNLLQAFEPKLNILIYHRVMPAPDPLRPWEIDTQQFRNHMEWISDVYNVIPLSDAVDQLKTGTLKRRSLSITFDDGYLDNATEALPLLKEFGFHATFFCTSAWLDGTPMWNDQVIESIRKWPKDSISIEALEVVSIPLKTTEEKNQAIATILPKLKYLPHNQRQAIADQLTAEILNLPKLMMQPKHIKLLHDQGMDIGGHTHSHPIIANLNKIELREELQKNKQALEDIVAEKIKLFAYPNGKPDIDFRQDQIEEIDRAGYKSAVTTQMGVASKSSALLTLPRFTPWHNSSFRYLALLASTSR